MLSKRIAGLTIAVINPIWISGPRKASGLYNDRRTGIHIIGAQAIARKRMHDDTQIALTSDCDCSGPATYDI